MISGDLTLMEFIGAYTDIILTLTVLIAVLYGVFFARRMASAMDENAKLSLTLREREFASKYDDERLSLERKIADMNLQLMRSQQKFEDVNHLIIDGQQRLSGFSKAVIDPKRFFSGISVDLDGLKIDASLVFVLTPFHPSEERTFSAVVEGFKGLGVRVIRGDETSIDGAILTHIIEQIVRARFVVANVSTRNPNVMYELGIAHALGKDVIMISNSKEEMPFDIKSRRILFYSDHEDLVKKLNSEIVRKVFDQQ
jgi:hypothetical protein